MATTITRRERSVGISVMVLLRLTNWLAIWIVAPLLPTALGMRPSILVVMPCTRLAMNPHADSARLRLSALIICSGPVPA